jgi:hypothetical protein
MYSNVASRHLYLKLDKGDARSRGRKNVGAARPMPPLLAFANVYFFEPSLFNGLRPIQIKNSLPVPGFEAVSPKALPLAGRRGQAKVGFHE